MTKTNNNEPMIELPFMKRNIFSSVDAQTHSFYLYDINGPENYTEWYEVIRNCGPHDTVYIHINSPGGRIDATLQLLRAMSECRGTIVASVEGECASAATMVFLAADGWEVSPHSIFMFHNYSGGAFGKGGEMFSKLEFEKKWSESMMRQLYEDFLTEEELTQIFAGEDKYFTSEEVMERLQVKMKAQDEADLEAELEHTNEEDLTNAIEMLKDKLKMVKKRDKVKVK